MNDLETTTRYERIAGAADRIPDADHEGIRPRRRQFRRRKTVATLSIPQALEDAGHEVQPAKAGPDFIDPSHHEAIADRPPEH